MTVLLLVLLIYFYTHYFFASITAHMLAMFPPFVMLLIGVGVPPLLAVYSLMCLANLTAGLTHYGTTTAPILFSQSYVTFGEWWRVGFVVSPVEPAIWLTVGFALVEAAGVLVIAKERQVTSYQLPVQSEKKWCQRPLAPAPVAKRVSTPPRNPHLIVTVRP